MDRKCKEATYKRTVKTISVHTVIIPLNSSRCSIGKALKGVPLWMPVTTIINDSELRCCEMIFEGESIKSD